jgi:4-aminobutyrate aminotransferase-like enzyme
LTEIERLGRAARAGAYIDVISRANAKVMEEVKAMGRNRVPTFEEVWASTGLVEKYRAQGEVIGEAKVRKEADAQVQAAEQRAQAAAEQDRLRVARNLITRIGLSPEQVAEAMGLDIATVRSLARKKS